MGNLCSSENCISVRSLLSIAIIHEFPCRSIDFIIAFNQAYIDVYVFMGIPLWILVDKNIVEWVINLNKSHYGLKQETFDWFYLIKTGL